MCGHLPAPIVMAEISFENGRISRARDLDLDLGSGHTAHRHASLIDIYLQTKFHWNQRNFVDGRTDVRTYGHLRPTLLGRLEESPTNVEKKNLFLGDFTPHDAEVPRHRFSTSTVTCTAHCILLTSMSFNNLHSQCTHTVYNCTHIIKPSYNNLTAYQF